MKQTELENLRTMAFFSGFSDAAFAKFFKAFTRLSLAKGDILFREGSEGDTFYIILSGEMVIEKKVDKAGGKFKKLALMNRGDFFGEMAVMESQPRFAQARAVQDSELVELSRHRLLDFIKDCPQEGAGLLIELLRVILGRLRHTSNELMTAHSFMEVLAKYKKR
ncbi:MAG: hypothetical protein A2X35_01675 [Elusimicrobia bacterium GWA2_61_42]|nr:MAG: hypothetical protein A2X35_01675 [Elusimicrobia bacterium GWA2_61_42]OGR76856.1 MAG: hypothetical protein A2X38_11850 [Elusimicrobia bacterium GWC2_61_25]